jgi:hypothetical protein
MERPVKAEDVSEVCLERAQLSMERLSQVG